MEEFLHIPAAPSGRGLVLTHGAGGNAKAPMLVLLANAFCEAGYTVLRHNLAFRQHRAFGPPSPSTGTQDRQSLVEAVARMRGLVSGPVTLGGHSYGGRQSTLLAAEQPGLVNSLVLFSYPLYPPGRPAQKRTAHFPSLTTPALFVHGTKDPFGSVEELREALERIPAKHELLVVEGAGHDLKKGRFDLGAVIRIADIN